MKCSGVLQCGDGLSNKVSNIIRRQWTIWSCCLYVFYEHYYHIPSYSL